MKRWMSTTTKGNLMKYNLIVIIIYAVMFILMASVALTTNNVAAEILSVTWGFGLLVLASNYKQPTVL